MPPPALSESRWKNLSSASLRAAASGLACFSHPWSSWDLRRDSEKKAAT